MEGKDNYGIPCQEIATVEEMWKFLRERRKESQGVWVFTADKCDIGCHNTHFPETHLVKAFKKYGVDKNREKIQCEENMIRSFKRKYHHYSGNPPDKDDILEWLSIMRHWEAPVRFLDFTYCFWVAVYFAISRLDCEKKAGLVYAFDSTWFAKSAEKKLPSYASIKDKHEKDNRIIRSLMKGGRRLIYPVNPFRLNERLTAQHGGFFVGGDMGESLLDNVRAHIGYKKHIKKLVIDFTGDNKQDAICKRNSVLSEMIDDMNIDNRVLFPDLRGFCESLGPWLATNRARRKP